MSRTKMSVYIFYQDRYYYCVKMYRLKFKFPAATKYLIRYCDNSQLELLGEGKLVLVQR